MLSVKNQPVPSCAMTDPPDDRIHLRNGIRSPEFLPCCMKKGLITPEGFPGIFDCIMNRRNSISDWCQRVGKGDGLLPLQGAGYAGLQREHQPDYRDRHCGGNKITQDLFCMRPHTGKFQDLRCRSAAILKKMVPGTIFPRQGSVTIPDPALIDRSIRKTGILCQVFCKGSLPGAQCSDEQDFLRGNDGLFHGEEFLGVHIRSCSPLNDLSELPGISRALQPGNFLRCPALNNCSVSFFPVHSVCFSSSGSHHAKWRHAIHEDLTERVQSSGKGSGFIFGS